jgi:DNA-binding response OmpR family regulator
MIYLRDSIATGLRKGGYTVDVAGDGEEGLYMAETGDYDVLVLDIMLPKLDGLALLERYRQKGGDSLALMLTAKDTLKDKVVGLKTGADDYLVKPFAMEELEARVEALCRRRYGIRQTVIESEDLKIDLAAKEASHQDQVVPFKPREYRILEYLAMRRGEVVSRLEIEAKIYGDTDEVRSNTIESAISSIRRKLSEVGSNCPIETRVGMGYIFVD